MLLLSGFILLCSLADFITGVSICISSLLCNYSSVLKIFLRFIWNYEIYLERVVDLCV